ncbi:MAG: hypothetical protein US94_C0005G0009 [Berkelbacteria bacterium GW2011_GWB1_38_5]|uniref:Uncharacterized protein n=1 Tax=Berkelbacteria bacterium GW2011_GWB1_38_5 TaxID=1618336 RepID=A0A0G0K3W1_9BACT|nr:MAG: hypothetical protein US94_C0005G0009 [Berkelbacteria bacterium GW2011_GWB1_38_5]
MKKYNIPLLLKISNVVILFLALWSFFYFEPSAILRVLVVLLGIIGLWQINSNIEILSLINLYIGVNGLYNVRYGLAVPMAVIMIAVMGLTCLIFYNYVILKNFSHEENDLSMVFMLTVGLIVIEIFLTMSFWPVDPKTKSLVITAIFFLISKIIYLYANSMLSLKRAFGFVLVSLLVMGAVISLGWFVSF